VFFWGGFFRWVYPKKPTRIFGYVPGCLNPGVGWQVILCDPIWQMMLCSFLMGSPEELYTPSPYYLLLLFLWRCLAAIKNVKEKVEQFELLLRELPLANRVLLSWMIVHMTHVIARVTSNVQLLPLTPAVFSVLYSTVNWMCQTEVHFTRLCFLSVWANIIMCYLSLISLLLG